MRMHSDEDGDDRFKSRLTHEHHRLRLPLRLLPSLRGDDVVNSILQGFVWWKQRFFKTSFFTNDLLLP